MSQVAIRSILDIGGGIVDRQFFTEWEAVLENINNPNVKTDAVREITITLLFYFWKIKPSNKGTGIARILSSARSKLAQEPAEEGSLYLHRHPQALTLSAYSHNPQQSEFDFTAEKNSKVRPLHSNINKKEENDG